MRRWKIHDNTRRAKVSTTCYALHSTPHPVFIPVPRPRQVTRAKSEGARRNPSPSVTGSAVLHCEWLKPVYINPGTADSRPGGLGSRNVRPGQSNVEKVLPVDAAPTSAQMNREWRRPKLGTVNAMGPSLTQRLRTLGLCFARISAPPEPPPPLPSPLLLLRSRFPIAAAFHTAGAITTIHAVLPQSNCF